jgi:hypothetical protein
MKTEIKLQVKNRKSTFVELKDYCLFSMGDRTKEGDFLEVTEWANSEGYDLHISALYGEKLFHLTSGQWQALKKCIKAIEKSHEMK